MCERWTPRIISLCFTLFLLRCIFFLGNNNQAFTSTSHFVTNDEKYNPDDFVNLGFSLFEFEQAKVRETELEREYDVTAILLHWNRLEDIQKTLKYLLNTHLFKQIIIWNNNPQINLTIYHFINNNDSTTIIRVINSKENVKDTGKYYACVQSITRVCFYVGNDWNISHYIKSLIANFRYDPNLLQLVANSYTFYTNLIWTYFDNTIDLHSGFSLIDCSSIFLREYAKRHLQFINKFLINDSNSDDVKFMLKKSHRFSYYPKSPSFNDDLIFYTNILPFEIQNIPFNISRETHRNLPRDRNITYIQYHRTWKAVDSDLSTCWHSNQATKSGDFFAIDFLRAQTNITFILAVTHSPILQQNLDISISFDGLWWISYHSLKGIFTKKNETLQNDLHIILFDSSQFALGFESFRYISFKTINNSNQRFQICEIEIISKKNIIDISQDFHLLNI